MEGVLAARVLLQLRALARSHPDRTARDLDVCLLAPEVADQLEPPAPDSQPALVLVPHDLVHGTPRELAAHPEQLAVEPLALGFPHPGHTEFLGELTLRHFGETVRPVMMLWSQELAVVPATIHIPLAEVPRTLTQTSLETTINLTARELPRFGITAPRLAVAGLNPFSGKHSMD